MEGSNALAGGQSNPMAEKSHAPADRHGSLADQDIRSVIHPFTDGNGRVGRMLLQHVLTHRTEAPVPIPVSVPWSRDRDRYIEGLRHFQSGELDPWIEFAAGSMVLAVEWITSAEDRVSRLLAELRGRSTTRSGSAAAGIIDDLVEHPLVDGSTVAARYSVSRQAAHQALERLAAAGILTKRPFSRRTKGRPRMMYASTELIDLLGSIGWVVYFTVIGGGPSRGATAGVATAGGAARGAAGSGLAASTSMAAGAASAAATAGGAAATSAGAAAGAAAAGAGAGAARKKGRECEGV